MLDRGCQDFLAYYVDLSLDDTLKSSDILVARNFLHVLSGDLPKLSLAREIEFVIEMLSGTAPVSKAPFRMAQVELKELNSVARKDGYLRLCIGY